MKKLALLSAIFLISCTSRLTASLPTGTPLEDLPFEENGLSYHDSYFYVSEDGENWEERSLVAQMASVPEVIQLEQTVGPFEPGTLLAYFVDGTTKHGQMDVELGMSYSTDNGFTWSDRIFVPVEGTEDGVVVADPSLVQLEDGSLRLYYYDFGRNKNPSPTNTDPHRFYSATSSDGLTFELEAVVYEEDSLITDPEVMAYGDQWLLFFPKVDEGSIKFSISDDPLSWEESDYIDDMQGIPGVYQVDEEIRLMGCSFNGGIDVWTSTDAQSYEQSFLTWVGACDPNPILMNDGTHGLIVKTFSETFQADQGTQMNQGPEDGMTPPPGEPYNPFPENE